MKHLKTLFAAIATLAMAFSFAACGTVTDSGANTGGGILGGNGNQSSSNSSNNGNSSGSSESNSNETQTPNESEGSGNENQTPSEGEDNESRRPSEGDNKDDNQNKPDDEEEEKILVVYFSATNTTEGIAQKIQTATGSAIYEIVPAIPYTSADLNYNTDCRANREQNDAKARPAISGSVENIEQYDTVYIGYPIWWGQAPKIIYTFLESYDFSGKTLIPFCTSGSSPMGSSATNLHSLTPDATWLGGQRFSGSASQATITAWVNGLNY